MLEYLDRDAELEEGFRQLRDIKNFLDASPDFLQKSGLLNGSNDNLQMTYAVIARDEFGCGRGESRKFGCVQQLIQSDTSRKATKFSVAIDPDGKVMFNPRNSDGKRQNTSARRGSR